MRSGWRMGAVALLLPVSVARAGDPIVAVGGPPIVADGQTPATVQVWSPAIGTEAKVSVKGAELVGEPRVDGNDFLTFEVVPPAVSEAGELQLKVKLSSDDGKGAATLRLPVVPADRGTLAVTFDPPMFRHGVDNAVSIRIRPPPGPRSLDAQTVEVHSSIGIIDTVTAEEGGTFVARWRPPRELVGSQMALFAVVDAAAPDRVMGTAAYPVVVKKALELPAPAGATALLTVGDRQFGPLPVGPSGKVKFDVERDPRVSVGRLRVVSADGAISESNVELAFGEGPRFTFVPMPVGALALPSEKVQVTVLVVNPDGSPWTGKPPGVAVDVGTVSGVVAAKQPGHFVVSYTPVDQPGTVTFTATLEGQSASRTMKLVPPAGRDGRSGSGEPEFLDAGARDGAFAILGAAPGAVVASGGSLRGALSGSGPYSQSVRLDKADQPMVVRAGPAVTPTGRPVTRLYLWTRESTAQADGVRQIPLVVVAEDDQGQPVPGVELALSVSVGTGSVPASLTTGADGLAAGFYTVGNQVGPVTLSAEGAGVRTAAPIFLEGAGYSGDLMAVSGNSQAINDRKKWMESVAVARIGGPFGAPQPAVAPMTAADLARLEAEKKAQEKAARQAARTPVVEAPVATESTEEGAPGGSEAASAEGGSAPAAAPENTVTIASAPSSQADSLSVGFHVGTMPRSYNAIGDAVPAGETEFQTPGLNAPGFDARARKWFAKVGAETRIRYVSQTVDAPTVDDAIQVGGTDFLLGGLYRYPFRDALEYRFGAGFHSQPVSSFSFSQEGIEDSSQTLKGARVSSGIGADLDVITVDAEFGFSLYGLGAAAKQVDAVVAYPLRPNLSAQLVYTYTNRTALFAEDESTTIVQETMNGVFVGLGYTLP